MSYKKVQQLANKFIKTAVAAEFEDYTVTPAKTDHFVSGFLRSIRIALNELEGDLMTLKYRDSSKYFNRNQWKELGNFWGACINIYKGFNENKPEEGVKEFADLLLEKKDWLTKIMPAIQQHLKSTEVDFVPSPGLVQARADGLKELIRVVNEGVQYVKKNTSSPQSKTWKTQSPATGPTSSTFIGTPSQNRNSDEQTGVATPRPKRESL